MLGDHVNLRCRPLITLFLFCYVFISIVQNNLAHADTATKEVGDRHELTSDEVRAQSETEKQDSFLSDLQLSGYLKNETAYRYRIPRSITKIRNVAYINAKYPYSPRLKFNFSGWAYYDIAYNLFDYDTISARFERNASEPLAFIVTLPREKDASGAAIRELYADMYLDNLDVRLGKQFVVGLGKWPTKF